MAVLAPVCGHRRRNHRVGRRGSSRQRKVGEGEGWIAWLCARGLGVVMEVWSRALVGLRESLHSLQVCLGLAFCTRPVSAVGRFWVQEYRSRWRSRSCLWDSRCPCQWSCNCHRSVDRSPGSLGVCASVCGRVLACHSPVRASER